MKPLFPSILASVLLCACTQAGEHSASTPPARDEGAPTAASAGTAQQQDDAASSDPENAPPRVTSIDISTPSPKKGDTVRIAVAATDVDDDEISLSYEWKKNGELLAASTDSLDLSDGFRRGDKIEVSVTPEDGSTRGSPGRVVFIIGNASPQIASSPSEGTSMHNVFSYQVKAADGDNDDVTYSLKSAPPGMTIEPKTGLVRWMIPAEKREKASVSILVTDGHGGEAIQSFVLDVSSQP